jgi:hypothetical protein
MKQNLKNLKKLNDEIVSLEKKRKIIEAEYFKQLGIETDKFLKSGLIDIETFKNSIMKIKQTFIGD